MLLQAGIEGLEGGAVLRERRIEQALGGVRSHWQSH
jgi:hypothetical protein